MGRRSGIAKSRLPVTAAAAYRPTRVFWRACFCASLIGAIATARAEPDPRWAIDKLEKVPAEAFAPHCASMQLFAATSNAPQMRWIKALLPDDCEKRHVAMLRDLGPIRVKTIMESNSFRTGIKRCVETKKLPTWADCITRTRKHAIGLFVGFELTGNVCAAFLKEQIGDMGFKGICVPYTFSVSGGAEWKKFLAALYVGTNVWMDRRNCISEKKAGKTNLLTDATAELLGGGRTAHSAITRLEEGGFKCQAEKNDETARAQECRLELGGHRFGAAPGEGARASFFADIAIVRIKSDAAGGVADICTKMMSVGL